MVFVVDDDSGMRCALQKVLDAGGFHAQTFHSAEEMLEAGAPNGADCYVIDIHLRGLSGFGLWRRLAEKDGEIPVIFITAHDSPAARAEAESLGAWAYLTKPFSGRQLVEVVLEAVGSR